MLEPRFDLSKLPGPTPMYENYEIVPNSVQDWVTRKWSIPVLWEITYLIPLTDEKGEPSIFSRNDAIQLPCLQHFSVGTQLEYVRNVLKWANEQELRAQKFEMNKTQFGTFGRGMTAIKASKYRGATSEIKLRGAYQRIPSFWVTGIVAKIRGEVTEQEENLTELFGSGGLGLETTEK